MLFHLGIAKPEPWACKRCTFLNPSSEQSTCQICFSPSPSPSSSSSSALIPRWSCKACTFLNPYNNTNCEVCYTRAPVLSLSRFEDLNDTGLDFELDSSMGSVFLPFVALQKVEVLGTSSSRSGFCPFRWVSSS